MPPSSIVLDTTTGALPVRGVSLFRKIKIFLLIFVFSLILINFLIISFENNIGDGIKYIGNQFLLTTENLQKESQIILDRGTIYPSSSDSSLENLWSFIKNGYGIFSALFLIYIWLWLLQKIILAVLLWDNSKTTSAWVFAIILFILFQMIFILALTDKGVMTPIWAFRDFGLALYKIVKPTAEVANNFVNSTL